MAKGFKQAAIKENVAIAELDSEIDANKKKSSDVIETVVSGNKRVKIGKGFTSISSERQVSRVSIETKENIYTEYPHETILSEDDISLKEYLEVIYNLEKRRYEINQIIEKIQSLINSIKADYGFIGQIIFTLVISFLVIFLSVRVTLSMIGGGAAIILFTLPAIYCIYRIIKAGFERKNNDMQGDCL